MRILTYWTYSKNTGIIIEQKFRQGQIDNTRGWLLETREGDYIGLNFMQAARLIEEWNRLGNKNGYFYYLHKPDGF